MNLSQKYFSHTYVIGTEVGNTEKVNEEENSADICEYPVKYIGRKRGQREFNVARYTRTNRKDKRYLGKLFMLNNNDKPHSHMRDRVVQTTTDRGL
jgi:hypothetical protein